MVVSLQDWLKAQRSTEYPKVVASTFGSASKMLSVSPIEDNSFCPQTWQHRDYREQAKSMLHKLDEIDARTNLLRRAKATAEDAVQGFQSVFISGSA